MIATPIFMAVMLIDFPYHYLISLILYDIFGTNFLLFVWREICGFFRAVSPEVYLRHKSGTQGH